MRRLLLRDTIYTLKLTRRGQRIPSAIQSPLYLARDALEFIGAPYVCLDADAELGIATAHRRRLRKTPRVVLLDGGELVGVVPARAVRAACRGMPADTPLRTLADTRVVVVKGSIQVFDLIAVLREKRLRNAVMTRDGMLESADGILGVVTWEDLVESTNLSGSMERDDSSAS